MKKTLILAGVLASMAAPYAIAQEADGQADDAAMQSAKITIDQAIKAAEQKAGGKAASADFDTPDKGGESYYLVEVIGADGKEQKLAVNANTGDVTNAPADEEAGEGEGEND
jgi:uncharacterized membrane protein YkoI